MYFPHEIFVRMVFSSFVYILFREPHRDSHYRALLSPECVSLT